MLYFYNIKIGRQVPSIPPCSAERESRMSPPQAPTPARSTRRRAARQTRAPAAPSRKPDPLDPVFKALANADRRAILDLLRDQPQTTGAICQQLKWLDRCTVMQHLRALEQAELVIVQRQGRSRWNYLNHEPIQRAYRRWIHAYAEPAADLLVQLKQKLEPGGTCSLVNRR